jgi:general secretion pathway protein K
MVNAQRQRGVALITVLLVFALVAVIATEILQRSQLNLRSVGGLVETRQAYYYALAGEAHARQLLAQDIVERHSTTDTLIEPWAQTKDQQPFPIDNGNLQIEIHDLQGRFNLNNIVNDDGAANEEVVAQFRSLLTKLQINPNYANEWRDWIDRDPTRSANGAEDADYSGYLTASGREADISALRLLRSMQPEDYAKLASHVSVLPATTLLNINTADAAVLSTIMNESRAAQVVVRQQSGGYRTKDEFEPNSALPFDVTSNYFEVLVTVNYANRWQRVRTVLKRKTINPGTVSFDVISRVRSPLIDDSEL